MERQVAQQRQELEAIDPRIAMLLDAIEVFGSGGKLLRPLFCFAGWLTAGGDAADARIPQAASAFEWLQASALAHDDLMDDSDTRRGKPSLHKHFAAHQPGSPSDAHDYGRSAAVLAGDLMLSWSDGVLRTAFEDTADCDRLHAALRFLDLARSEVVAGQFLDISAQHNSVIDIDQAAAIMRFKSAKYTVERPLHAGAALAGADADLISALSDYALPLGEAFQLRDDLLGVFGDPAVTGKPAGDDLREGKRTMLIARALELANANEHHVISQFLGDPQHVDLVRQAIDSCGARAAVELDIDRRLSAANQAIEQLPYQGQSLLNVLLIRASRRDH